MMKRADPVVKSADWPIRKFIRTMSDEIVMAKMTYLYKDQNYISDGPTGWSEDEKTPLYSYFRVDIVSSAWSFFGSGKDLAQWIWDEDDRAARWDRATLTLDNGVLRGTYCDVPISIEDNHSVSEIPLRGPVCVRYVCPIYQDERGHWRQWSGPLYVDTNSTKMGWW